MKPKTASHHRRWVLRLFEWAVLLLVILLLMSLFLQRSERLQAEAERLTFQATVDALQSAVRYISLLQDQRPALYGALLKEGNPMPLLAVDPAQVPSNYLGELQRPDPRNIAGGQWYFDRSAGVLVYRVKNRRFFDSDWPGPAMVRYRLVGQQAGRASGDVEGPLQKGQLLTLAAEGKFSWK